MARRRKSKSHRSRKRRGTDWSAIGGAVLLLFAIIGIVALIAARFYFGNPEKIDPVTLCPVSGPTQAFAVVLDVTDPLQSRMQRRVESILKKEIAQVPSGTRLTLGMVSSDPVIRNNPKFNICKPLEGKDASNLYQNPAIIAKRFNTYFVKPLDDALVSLLSAEPADTSPIMESIQATVISAFQGLTEDTPKRLIIVSDLLQHSDVFSFYRGGNWNSLESSPDFGRLGRNLSGVDVMLYQLPRPKASNRQGSQMLEFWRRYFEVQGANRVQRNVVGDL